MEWYNGLAKPSWTPSPSTSSLTWMTLYPSIIASFGFAFAQAIRGKVPWKVAVPFTVNLVANVLCTPIFPGLRNVPLARVDILIVGATILWCVLAAWSAYKWAAVAQVPCGSSSARQPEESRRSSVRRRRWPTSWARSS
jgi:tryptophan-rich sensory protein